MIARGLRHRVERLEATLITLSDALPREEDLAAHVRGHPHQDLLQVANDLAPLVLLFMRRRGHGEAPSFQEIRQFLKSLSEGQAPGRGPEPRNMSAISRCVIVR